MSGWAASYRQTPHPPERLLLVSPNIHPPIQYVKAQSALDAQQCHPVALLQCAADRVFRVANLELLLPQRLRHNQKIL